MWRHTLDTWFWVLYRFLLPLGNRHHDYYIQSCISKNHKRKWEIIVTPALTIKWSESLVSFQLYFHNADYHRRASTVSIFFRKKKKIPSWNSLFGCWCAPPPLVWRLVTSAFPKEKGWRFSDEHPKVITEYGCNDRSFHLPFAERNTMLIVPYSLSLSLLGLPLVSFLNAAYMLFLVTGPQWFMFSSFLFKSDFTWTMKGYNPVETCELKLWFLSMPLEFWCHPGCMLSSIPHFILET